MTTRGTRRTRGRVGLAGALVVAAAALASCTSIGAVDQADVTAEAQARGGGITTDLVAEAVAAVAEEADVDPLVAHSITAGLATVTVVVPPDAGGGAAQAWRYGTSGRYGGRGLSGPTSSAAAETGAFPVGEAGLDGIDDAVDLALATAELPGGWVESVTVARPSEGAAPVTTLVVTDGATERPVVVAADGTLVEAGR